MKQHTNFHHCQRCGKSYQVYRLRSGRWPNKGLCPDCRFATRQRIAQLNKVIASKLTGDDRRVLGGRPRTPIPQDLFVKLAAEGWGSDGIARRLSDAGYPVSEPTIRRRLKETKE